MTTESKTICSYLAGSHSYGLDTVQSDADYRGVYLTTDVGEILGTRLNFKSCEHIYNKELKIDNLYFELRHFFRILQSGSSNAMELLFNESWLIHEPTWAMIRKHRMQLVNPDKVYKSLSGHIHNEIKQFNSAIDYHQLGSVAVNGHKLLPNWSSRVKHIIHVLRLAKVGWFFFTKGDYPLDLADCSFACYSLLRNIQQTPTDFPKEELMELVTKAVNAMDDAYIKNKIMINHSYAWNDCIVEQLVLEAYYPILTENTYK